MTCVSKAPLIYFLAAHPSSGLLCSVNPFPPFPLPSLISPGSALQNSAEQGSAPLPDRPCCLSLILSCGSDGCLATSMGACSLKGLWNSGKITSHGPLCALVFASWQYYMNAISRRALAGWRIWRMAVRGWAGEGAGRGFALCSSGEGALPSSPSTAWNTCHLLGSKHCSTL